MSWIDDTTPSANRTKWVNGEALTLVFSEEFNKDVEQFPDRVTVDAATDQPGVKWTATSSLNYDKVILLSMYQNLINNEA